MVATIPVPIQFSLPEGWRSVSPDQVDAPDAAFVALRPPASKGFTPNITISGDLQDAGIPLTQLADEAVERLRRGAPDAELGKRKESGSERGPGLTQAVRMTLRLNGVPEQLLQLQVFLGMRDTRDPSRYAVVEIVLSALAEQFPGVVGEFQQFLSTIRPEEAR
ncbi:DcrB/PsbP domain-containing protein [Amycolatopsis alkalitolerans]|uniref:DUF1795 domain-containing protein n=1 Tax=Amycolatopsis alkalitolerans TaxID=2547244 RepID=A0A5C4LUA5_9PSEU|nr:DUF1795 domain-containing protein [Amycolatopsis alkalitolerans]TNC22475.1 DUF1795 domain-containing protein [Amycolatopsis alkalitolerans]